MTQDQLIQELREALAEAATDRDALRDRWGAEERSKAEAWAKYRELKVEWRERGEMLEVVRALIEDNGVLGKSMPGLHTTLVRALTTPHRLPNTIGCCPFVRSGGFHGEDCSDQGRGKCTVDIGQVTVAGERLLLIERAEAAEAEVARLREKWTDYICQNYDMHGTGPLIMDDLVFVEVQKRRDDTKLQSEVNESWARHVALAPGGQNVG